MVIAMFHVLPLISSDVPPPPSLIRPLPPSFAPSPLIRLISLRGIRPAMFNKNVRYVYFVVGGVGLCVCVCFFLCDVILRSSVELCGTDTSLLPGRKYQSHDSNVNGVRGE